MNTTARHQIDFLADWLSVDEFAARAGVSTKTVRRWIKAHRVNARRVGPKFLRIDPNDLSKLVTSAEV